MSNAIPDWSPAIQSSLSSPFSHVPDGTSYVERKTTDDNATGKSSIVPNCIEVAEKVNLVSLPTTFSPESMNRTNLIPILSSPTYPSLPLIFAEPLVSLSPPPLSYKFEFTQRLGWLLFGRWVVMNRSSLLNIANIAFAFLRIVLPVLFILCALFLFHAPILVAFFLILFGDCHDSKGPAVSLLRLLHYFIFYVCIREILVPPEEALQTHRPTL